VVSEGEVSEFLKQNLSLLRERLEGLGFGLPFRMTAGPVEMEKEIYLRDLEGESQALLSWSSEAHEKSEKEESFSPGGGFTLPSQSGPGPQSDGQGSGLVAEK